VGAYMTEDFALVLMDMQMPVMNGLAATRAIWHFETTLPNRRRTPIIMLSANHLMSAIGAKRTLDWRGSNDRFGEKRTLP
jgi:CheY-like chemotaxis protein